MFVSRLNFYLIVFIAPAILCLRDDYYDEYENFEGPEDTHVTKSSLRETDVGNQTNITEFNVLNSEDSEYEDEDYIIFKKYKTESYTPIKLKLITTAPIPRKVHKVTTPRARSTSTDRSRIEDYDYESDVSSMGSMLSNDTDSDDHQHDNEDDYSKDIDSWVVPEQVPCWDLPILYGDMEPRKHEVFSIHIEELRNVKYENRTKKSSSISPRPLKNNDNPRKKCKWCLKAPCYADHTLCFFADNNSVFCDSQYKVKTPNVLDQMVIVNTINAMRNRVATRQSKTYKHLPTAANMKQLIYNYDLQKMAITWLKQCLPGPATCSALNNELVGELECTKYAKFCCLNKEEGCKPLRECFVSAIIGCIHVWFESAGASLTAEHIRCGHIHRNTYHTVQLLWAGTTSVGCAFGKSVNGDERVLCYFSPSAPFRLTAKYYCGIIPHHDIIDRFDNVHDVTSTDFAAKIGISIINHYDTGNKTLNRHQTISHVIKEEKSPWFGVDSIVNIYQPGWARNRGDNSTNNTFTNGTLGYIARMVTKYRFKSVVYRNCSEGVYEEGAPGSSCNMRGRRFSSLCYDFGDPTPGYRLVAIIAPMALFTLILYDLFNGVVRQTNSY
ncbi:unnamed protein product [Plutella xylostella]|uniref:(diamondback moth) hypothetical protein n=1 Tax=Plutella xylostella TaxID=51655 RepID=A0A8S4DSG4_PLUXY|nr:unnamed protein product [Plutella xylostella]